MMIRDSGFQSYRPRGNGRIMRRPGRMVMNGLGEDAASSGSVFDSVISLAKSALPIWQQQQVFNQQLKAGATPVIYGAAPQASAPSTNWGTVAVVGGLGVLGFMLVSRMMRLR